MVAFRDLWYRHPANNSTQYPCIAPYGLTNMEGKHIAPGFPVFGNQCAIRMGVCLKNAGVSPGALRLATCGVHGADEMHIIRAADLARALAGASIEGVGKVERITVTEAAQLLQQALRPHRHHLHPGLLEAPRRDDATGDHIDVWNGYRSSTKWLMEWFSWLGYYSNYAQAKEIWFWDVK